MEVMEAAKTLSESIRESAEYTDFERAKAEAFENETSAALLKEFGRLQTQLQMYAVAGREMDPTDVQRFQQMSALLYAAPATSAYLMAQMRLQKLLADIFGYLSNAAGMPIEMPSGMDSNP